MAQRALNGAADVCREQRHGCAEIEALVRLTGNRDAHETIVEGDVEEFVASGPSHLGAAAERNLHLASESRKRLHVDFEVAGFVGLKGDPLAVGRELAIPVRKTALHD